MPVYDVALWLHARSTCPRYVEDVEAASPLRAALALMRRYRLRRVFKAAIALDGVIERWMSLECALEAESEDADGS